MKTAIRTFEDLEVWQLGLEICIGIYRFTNDRKSPVYRDFVYRDQIRKAGLSIISNIAEGFESRTLGLYIDFVGHAKGSAGEVRSPLRLGNAISYLSADAFEKPNTQLQQCSRQLHALIASLAKNR
jgi:four helix bundle protein